MIGTGSAPNIADASATFTVVSGDRPRPVKSREARDTIALMPLRPSNQDRYGPNRHGPGPPQGSLSQEVADAHPKSAWPRARSADHRTGRLASSPSRHPASGS